MTKREFNAADWTSSISSKKTGFNLNLSEVWKYKDLVFLFVKRDFAAQFKQTVLGPLWHVIQPVFTTIVFLVLFNKIAKIPTDEVPATLFYMAGITIWNYFSACFINTSSTFITNASIFGKVYFPRLVLPISVIISNMVKFSIQFVILIATIIFFALFKDYHIVIGWQLLLIPVICCIMAVLGLSTGIIISSVTTKYRDLHVLIGFGIQLFMYITPVAYSMGYLKDSKYFLWIKLNPLSSLIEGFRYAVFGTGYFEWAAFLYSIGFTVVAFFIGVIMFNKVEKTFMDTV